MIIKFLAVNCPAGSPLYLLRHGADRVVAWIGAPLLFTALSNALITTNPVTTGVLSWEKWIEPELAINVTLDFLQNWLLAGVDMAAVPFLIVVHRETNNDEPGGYRIAVHFSVANVHLGLLKSIRPYVFSRDEGSLIAWQNKLNRDHGWKVPEPGPAEVRFAYNRVTIDARHLRARLGEYIKKAASDRPDFTKSESDFRRIVESALSSLKHESSYGANVQPGAAIMVQEEDSGRHMYSLIFSSQSLPLCTWSPRRINRHRPRHIPTGSFAELRNRRLELFLEKPGEKWTDPIVCAPRIREFLRTVNYGPPMSLPEIDHEIPSAEIQQPAGDDSPSSEIDKIARSLLSNHQTSIDR